MVRTLNTTILEQRDLLGTNRKAKASAVIERVTVHAGWHANSK